MKTLFIKKEELQLLLTGASDGLLIPNRLREALELPEDEGFGCVDEGACFCEEHAFAPELDTVPMKSMGNEIVSVIFSRPTPNPYDQLKDDWAEAGKALISEGVASSPEVKRWLEEETDVQYDWSLTQPDMPWRNA